MNTSPRVTVLISGRGSNLVALHEKAVGYRVTSVISNRADAAGLGWAAERGIACQVVARSDFQDLARHKHALLQAVISTNPDVVTLAGFMMILQPEFVDMFKGRLLNIHPSLLPKYPGLHTHERALEAGEREHGCSVHFVEAGLDTGPVVAQAKVPVLPGDTAQLLAERTLTVEHELYPWVVRHLTSGEISLAANEIQRSDNVYSEALNRGFILPRRSRCEEE